METTSIKKIDVVIIGVHKCATTSLWKMLSQHGDIVTHESGQLTGDYIQALEGVGVSENLDNLFSKLQNKTCILIRDTTLYDDPSRISRLVRLNADIKIIICIRDPIRRSFSAFQHALLRGFEDRYTDFTSVVEELINGDLPERSPPLLNYFDQSLYGKHLEALLDSIAPANIMLVDSDYISKDAIKLCRQCFEFLGVDDMVVEEQRLNSPVELRSARLNHIIRHSVFVKSVVRRLLGAGLRLRVLNLLNALNRRTKKNTKGDGVPESVELNLKKYFDEDQRKFEMLVTNLPVVLIDGRVAVLNRLNRDGVSNCE